MARCSLYFRKLWEGKRCAVHDRLVVACLAPFSFAYCLIMAVRALLYRGGVFPTRRLAVPVISIGNLSVGGTGKTPVTALVARHLISRGYRPAVISRGYGASGRGDVRIVSDGSEILLTPEESGDEPYLLARSTPGLIVVTGRDRYNAGKVAIDRFQPDVFLLDDGFQHLGLHRDLNILLLDGVKPFGNGFALPAGLLREPVSAARRADLVIFTRCSGAMPNVPFGPIPSYRATHEIGSIVSMSDGERVSVSRLSDLRGVAFAGIADPDSFFHMIRQKGMTIVAELAFPDHCAYDGREVDMILSRFRSANGDYLITTEKDEVKLLSNDAIRDAAFAARLEVTFPEWQGMVSSIEKILAGRRNSMSLSEELLAILVCPNCKGGISLCKDGNGLLCAACRLKYPIRDGIPVMLVDEAEKIVQNS